MRPSWNICTMIICLRNHNSHLAFATNVYAPLDTSFWLRWLVHYHVLSCVNATWLAKPLFHLFAINFNSQFPLHWRPNVKPKMLSDLAWRAPQCGTICRNVWDLCTWINLRILLDHSSPLEAFGPPKFGFNRHEVRVQIPHPYNLYPPSFSWIHAFESHSKIFNISKPGSVDLPIQYGIFLQLNHVFKQKIIHGWNLNVLLWIHDHRRLIQL